MDGHIVQVCTIRRFSLIPRAHYSISTRVAGDDVAVSQRRDKGKGKARESVEDEGETFPVRLADFNVFISPLIIFNCS